MMSQTLYQGLTNGRILDADYPVELIDLPPLDLPPLRTHERFMAEHEFDAWLVWLGFLLRDADALRRFRRRERDRARRKARRS